MLWVLKRAVSFRRFFWAPKTHVYIDGYENNNNFTLIKMSLFWAMPGVISSKEIYHYDDQYNYNQINSRLAARPFGLHYNHYVSPSVRPLPVSENVNNSWTIWYILSHFAYICMSTFPNHWHAKLPVLIDIGLLCNCPAFCGQLVKILKILVPYGIFESNFTYSFILILSSHPGMQDGDMGLPSRFWPVKFFKCKYP